MILLFLDRVECEAQNIDLQVTLEILLPAPLSQVRDFVNETIARITAWSLKHAASGKAPTHGYYGEKFAPNSFRSGLAGKTLANNYKILGCCLVTSLDAKFSGFAVQI